MGDFGDIASSLQRVIIALPALLVALTFHEYAHAAVAVSLGDPTPRLQGRLSLNPLVHLDPLGFLAILFAPIGWAKPVLITPTLLRNPRRDAVLVAAAGPGMNLLLAAVSAVLYRLLLQAGGTTLPPLGAAIVTPLHLFTVHSIVINVSLAVFNMLPIPPLDGWRVVGGLVAGRNPVFAATVEQYGSLVLLVLIVTGVVGKLMSPVVATTVFFLVQA